MGVDAEMFVKVRPPMTDRQVQRIAFEMAGAFGHEKFWIDREQNRRALTVVEDYTQDGPTIQPKTGEQFVRVSLWSRYYGEGYERGDAPLIIMVAEWLEHRLRAEPGNVSAEVWYGGDSSGINAYRFDAKARLALFKHFVGSAHRPYDRGWDEERGLSRHCKFCDEPMNRYGYGANYASFACRGCGLEEESRDGFRTWQTPAKPTRAEPPTRDGAAGWVLACLEHEDCRKDPELGVHCIRKAVPSPSTPPEER